MRSNSPHRCSDAEASHSSFRPSGRLRERVEDGVAECRGVVAGDVAGVAEPAECDLVAVALQASRVATFEDGSKHVSFGAFIPSRA